MIEKIEISYDGPDGTWLVIEDSEKDVVEETFCFELTDEACVQLDRALQPWRNHMAEGERVRVEFSSHLAQGKCSHWLPGVGPCQLMAGHEGEHNIAVGNEL